MLRHYNILWAVPVLVGQSFGCGPNVASQLAEAPEFDPGAQQSKCQVKQSQNKPLIVEWPSADRAELEAAAKGAVVVVKYNGCEMQLLSRCQAPGKYSYVAVTPKKDTLSIKDEDDLWANMPIGAASLEAKLAKAGELNVVMTMVGRHQAPQSSYRARDLKGSCDGATHVISGLTVGAFEFFAGAAAEVGGGVNVLGAGAGAKSRYSKETLTQDGDLKACEAASKDAPPADCAALLRVEVAPLTGRKEAEKAAMATASCADGPFPKLTKEQKAHDRKVCRDDTPGYDIVACDRFRCEILRMGKACERMRNPPMSECSEIAGRTKNAASVGACVKLCEANQHAKCHKYDPSHWPCASSGGAYQTGALVPQDEKRAIELWERGCKQQESVSCGYLAKRHFPCAHSTFECAAGREPLGKGADVAKAAQYFKLACEYGSQDSCGFYRLLKDKPPKAP
jgi:hypothetical protein